MTTSTLSALLEDCRRLVGKEHVTVAVAGESGIRLADVGRYRDRVVEAVLRPQDRHVISDLMKLFATTPDPPSIYPLSSGRNWGLGSKKPVKTPAIILDLNALTKMKIDYDAGIAVIEPGVTQGMLARTLKTSNYMLNVTASAAETSVLGNAVERGVGFYRQRTEDVLGYEAILPSGDIVRTGMIHSHPPERGVFLPYSHGLGPGLTPLFEQSNLGIVTEGAIALIPRPQSTRVVRFAFPKIRLEDTVDCIAQAYKDELVRVITRIYHPETATSYGFEKQEEFVGYTCINGMENVCEITLTEFLKRLESVKGLSAEVISDGDVLTKSVVNCYHGDPGSNEEMIESLFGVPTRGIDEKSRTVWRFVLMLVPFRPSCISEAYGIVRSIGTQSGVSCSATINVLSHGVADLAVNMRLPKVSGYLERLNEAQEAILEGFVNKGFVPYRLDVDHMPEVGREIMDGTAGGLTSGYGVPALAQRLKADMDPLGLLAPGRYLT